MGYILIPYLLFLIPFESLAYPVFGTKRYGRTAPIHNWAMSNPVQFPSYYYLPRTHYPLNYYDAMSPYAQEYTDEYYYPQENLNYPVYYPVRGPKYDYYQPLPYYYDGRHYPRYNYYEDDPVDDLQEEIQQEEEREQREEALPVGQETWYENDDNQNDDSMDDINAAFLQNLMIYNDAMSNKNYDYQPDYLQNYNEDVLNWNDDVNKKYEDEDVKELKMLAGKPKKQRNKNKNKYNEAEERIKLFDKAAKKTSKNSKDPNNSEAWINWSTKRQNTMKNTIDPIANLAYKKQELSEHGPLVFKDNAMAFSTRKQNTINHNLFPSSTISPITSKAPENHKDTKGGQKEVVLIRPATPVRRPFSEPVMELLAKQNQQERKRTPSVYDTIKHLLEMEKSLEEVS